MTVEKHFDAATHHAAAALQSAERLPKSQFRSWAVDDLEAAIGWIKQARDLWAQEPL